MSRPSQDYSRCPACGRRTVLFHFGRGGEDYLACSWRGRKRETAPCGWECFRWPDNDSDRRELARWEAANPAAPADGGKSAS